MYIDSSIMDFTINRNGNITQLESTGTGSGSISLIIGCMFAGKTSRIVAEVNKLSSIGLVPLVINSMRDNRYSMEEDSGEENGVLTNYMHSHNRQKVKCVLVEHLFEIPKSILDNYQHILINEAQFFSDLKEIVVKWCDDYGKNIIVSGLNGDFKREKFGKISDLLSYADHVEMVKGYCKLCGSKSPSYALFTMRTGSETDQTVVGGEDNYIPVCRKHYLQHSKVRLCLPSL